MKKRGFALMDKLKLREITSRGGKRAHKLGVAYEFSPEQGKIAGRNGGLATQAKRKSSPATCARLD